MTGLKQLSQIEPPARRRRIVNALHGRAVIEGVSATGRTRDDNPEVELVMTIELPGRAPYEATHRQVVSRQVMHHLGTGLAVSVTVDADDPARLEIG